VLSFMSVAIDSINLVHVRVAYTTAHKARAFASWTPRLVAWLLCEAWCSASRCRPNMCMCAQGAPSRQHHHRPWHVEFPPLGSISTQYMCLNEWCGATVFSGELELKYAMARSVNDLCSAHTLSGALFPDPQPLLPPMRRRGLG
jgi:hypothetical protein